MSKHNSALCGLHTIVTRNAYAQAMFFFVDGYLLSNPGASPREGILVFRDRYRIDSMEVDSAVTMYNRLRGEYLVNNQIFNNDDTRKTPDPGPGGILRQGMGTARQQ